MPLCLNCSSISLEALREGCSNLSNAQQLWDSSLTCALCHLIRSSLNNDTAKEIGNALETRYYNTVAKAPIVLYGVFQEEDNLDDDDDTIDHLKLIGIDVHVPLLDDEIDISNLGVYQDEADGDDDCIIGRPSLHEAGGEAAMQLLKMWMLRCNAEHHRCSQITTSGYQLALPTRVLDISEDEVRLYISRGEDEKYAALSHCWGPDPPIKTLKSNFSSHLRGICFERLPNTFRQAIQVARELSLKYIWIDSLCIIQDDKSDWEKEAIKMGSVYEGAEITIAATGSTNAHDGCFIPRPKM
ncbi:heterokaryon incompatibility protein-domain-containing protein, partial [Lophiotrema nucula]